MIREDVPKKFSMKIAQLVWSFLAPKDLSKVLCTSPQSRPSHFKCYIKWPIKNDNIALWTSAVHPSSNIWLMFLGENYAI